MKKIFLVIFILILFCTFSVRSYSDYEFLMYDDSYNLYNLNIEGLDTNNFFNYFDGINVTSISPYINPIYKDRIGDFSYEISSYDLHYEIDNFKKKYLDSIKKNGYTDYSYLYLNGINIDKVSVYISGKKLYNFLFNNSDLLINIVK